MKKPWLFIFVSFIGILFTTESICQVKQQDSQVTQDSRIEFVDLVDIKYIFSIYGDLTSSSWSLGIGFGKPEYRPKSYKDVEKDIDEWFRKCKRKILWKDRIHTHNLSVKYETDIRKLFGGLSLIGGQLAMFLYHETPFIFAKKDNEIALIVNGIGSSIVYNTLRTTSKKRATEITGSVILPLMKVFRDAFKDTGIKHYGLIVAYGSKDFANPYLEGSLEPEVVIFIVSAENCKKFCERVITDDDLVVVSEVYLKDRDMKDFKRIKVNLE